VILVCGATGATGSVVVRELLERGLPVRGLTRSRERAEELRALGAEVAIGDLNEPASLWDAFNRVERVYLATPSGPDQAAQEVNAISVAEQAGAYHVVRLACVESAVHEQVIEQLEQSALRAPVLGAGPETHPGDVGEVAALALAVEGHEDTTYELTPGSGAIEQLLGRPPRTGDSGR